MCIISELYNSKDLDDCIIKMVREDLRDDFKQELFVLILSHDQERIKEIYDRGELKYYVVRLIINLATQSRNIFHKKYLNKSIEREIETDIKDESDPEAIEEKEVNHEKVMKHISQMDDHFKTFYYRALTDIIKKHGTMREAARQTGIPVSTISRGIKKIREHLKVVNV